MQPNLEEFQGRICTLSFVPIKKERKGFEEKSKSKRRKKDFSKERQRKRGEL